jgi:RNA polymerase sigma factor (sigma-70 family)
MPAGPMTTVIRRLRRAVSLRDGVDLTDSQLLAAFLEREDSAFEELVRRYGRMVLGVCRRVLGNSHDAEDAFQAAFLVFLRKAASLRQRDLLGNWLYGVAYRTALEAKASRARRRVKEMDMRSMPRNQGADCAWRDLQPLLDHELNRLPDKYRVPILLCDLEGKGRKEAALQLGWPEGTLSGRLARARNLLAKRMSRYGPTLSGGALASALACNTASAAVPTPLSVSTIQAIAAVSGGQTAASAASVQVAALTQGVLTAMLLSKLKIVCACFLLIAMSGLFAVQVLGEPREDRIAQRSGRSRADLGQVSFQAGQPDRTVAKKKARIYLYASLKVKRAGDDDEQDFRGIIAIDPDTGKWWKITGDGNSPRISPDGETVIFTRHTGGAAVFADSVLWNCDTGGSDNPGKISDIGGVPSWSPDGKYLVVNKSKLKDDVWTHRAFRIDANGANPKELAIPKTDEVDDWSPDGKWFVTVSDRHPPHGRGYQLYVMHPDGTGERRLTRDGLNCYPRFSPDSRKIVYLHQTAKAGNSVWTVDIDGKNAREILKEENLVSPDFACWSPDGKRLAVTRFKWELGEDGRRRGPDSGFMLEIMDADGQNRRIVTLADAKIRWLGHAEWR